MNIIGRYDNWLLNIIDLICYGLTYPFLYFFSGFFSTVYDVPHLRQQSLIHRLTRFLWGLFFCSWLLVTLPLYITGQVYWTLLYSCFAARDFIRVDFKAKEAADQGPQDDESFGFLSANLLLGFDALGTFQNMKHVGERHSEFRRRFAQLGSQKPWQNLAALSSSGSKADSIASEFMRVDFIMFQEVWDRFYAGSMVQVLKDQGFQCFIMDISRQSWSGNYCTGSSGLMLASRYPILEAKFIPYRNKRSWQKFISYGALLAKVDLGRKTLNGRREVGYLGDLHTMAYQEKENQIEQALTLTQDEFRKFREKHTTENEEVVFATLGGDFNFDNMSPGDAPTQKHPLFREYLDVGAQAPGVDRDWTIGTEWRQLRIHDEEVSTPEDFRSILVDDVLRRYYILDADVEVQTTELMVCDPRPDSEGQIKAEVFGGKRRIDRILYDPKCPTQPTGFGFYTTLTGITDHVPVSLTLSRT
ncbi:hypothetical protein TCAL_02291 [Tigriopus californicus]|uniref:sphingomyelin phosphodiesterase n=1 Tax=Tigriopus californicus TaxID=6832 RepID=A0A553NQK7_TIGCA|nr:sphingomyelin phosphodiesterase 3-like [Tigriopus californicus]TRY67707.1 hypothetical protein TCAL_02291 [Tigriopus californicus]